MNDIASAARRQASISELEAAIRLLRYSAKKGGLSQPHTERMIALLWQLEEIVQEVKGPEA